MAQIRPDGHERAPKIVRGGVGESFELGVFRLEGVNEGLAFGFGSFAIGDVARDHQPRLRGAPVQGRIDPHPDRLQVNARAVGANHDQASIAFALPRRAFGIFVPQFGRGKVEHIATHHVRGALDPQNAGRGWVRVRDSA